MEITLIFPHQLFRPHPAVAGGRRVFLVEDPLFFGPDSEWPTRMHRQKLILHRASMQAYAKALRDAGFTVTYLACPLEGGRTEEILDKEIPRSARSLHVADPVDDVLSRRLHRFSSDRGLSLTIHETPQFLTPVDFLERCFAGGRKPFMARFYEQQRRRMGLLVSVDGKPTGGRWSFDEENRRKLPRDVEPPDVPWLPETPALREVRAEINRQFPQARGDDEAFRYPTTQAEAESWLDDFLSARLAYFGAFEDAISTRHRTLFHSVLTPALNVGLLTPAVVVERTMRFAAERKIPLNSLEGFIRQIIGWREFMRAMYERQGRRMRTMNFWKFQRALPGCFYEGTTGIAPVDHVIRQVRKTGYCHHIERLMILGNFLLLCRIRPDDVYRWFMEMFIDSYDWVMVPNVYGMSQFADGGGFTTKPYLSGSNYVLKMSDFRRGPWCEVWDALFWTFVVDHQEVLAHNPRLNMLVHRAGNLGAGLQKHRRVADEFLARMDQSITG